jgi:hypothetical protein
MTYTQIKLQSEKDLKVMEAIALPVELRGAGLGV